MENINLPHLTLNNYRLNKNIVKIIPEEMARFYHIIAIENIKINSKESILSIAVTNVNPVTLQVLENRLNCKVIPILAKREAIIEYINKYY